MLTDRTCRNTQGRKELLYIPIIDLLDRYHASIMICNSASGRDPGNPSRSERPWKHGSARLVQPPDDIGSEVQQPYQPAIEAVEEGVFVQTSSVVSYRRTLERGTKSRSCDELVSELRQEALTHSRKAISSIRSVQHASLIYHNPTTMTPYPRPSIPTHPHHQPNPHSITTPPPSSPFAPPTTPLKSGPSSCRSPPLPSPTYRRSIHTPHPHSHSKPPCPHSHAIYFQAAVVERCLYECGPLSYPVPFCAVLGCALLGWFKLKSTHTHGASTDRCLSPLLARYLSSCYEGDLSPAVCRLR
jgi:hypothetical protein